MTLTTDDKMFVLIGFLLGVLTLGGVLRQWLIAAGAFAVLACIWAYAYVSLRREREPTP